MYLKGLTLNSRWLDVQNIAPECVIWRSYYINIERSELVTNCFLGSAQDKGFNLNSFNGLQYYKLRDYLSYNTICCY